MHCRRCKAEIADGSQICPACGVKQTAYTDLLSKESREEKHLAEKKRKWIPMLSVMTVIVIIYVMMGFMRQYNLSNRITQIRETYERLQAAADKGEADEAGNSELFLQVGQFVKNYPNTPEAEEAQSYLEALRQATASGGELPSIMDAVPGQSKEQALRAALEEGVVSVIRIEPGGPGPRQDYDVSIRWRNRSLEEISEIIFILEARDADGNAVACTERDASGAALRAKGPFPPSDEEYKQTWLEVWFTEQELEAVLTGVMITFADESSMRIPESMIEYVYKP